MYSRIIKFTVIFVIVPALFGVSFGYALVNYLEIPDVKQLEIYRPKSATRLYADDGTLYAEIFVEKRVPIPITEMPRHLKLAFVAIEDVRFYHHFGIDARGIVRAAYKNIIRKGMTEGASTIPQQLARNLYLSPQKTFKRKVEEAILAIQIERTYSKEEILNMYLNLIYLGEGAHGVESAAYTYFHKHARDLTLPESAMLAAMTKSPSRLSPYKNPERAGERKNIVLQKMYEAGFITNKEYKGALKATIALAPFKAYEKKTGYYIEFVKQVLEEHVENPQEIYTTGFDIKTPISLQMTNYAYEAIERGIQAYMKRHQRAIPPEVALIAMEIKTGDLKVLIGGKNFAVSSYNRAVQAKRQPGSASTDHYLAALNRAIHLNQCIGFTESFTNPYTGCMESEKLRE